MRQQRAPVNPYLSLWLVPLIGASSWFLATKLGEEWWGWLVVGLFAAMAVLLLVQCLRAIPGWHRARAAARAYTAARGIPFPKELRWYN
ncbi:hypothetical protein LH407_05400 [Antiquaquibacter oligotrophicus]|nr:hypothetical protein [Antiquaquibacter oligotrophicus]UDF14298.1 hypothetical protein LH407_05400 [Antiquaquibacter oligotrophicus]